MSATVAIVTTSGIVADVCRREDEALRDALVARGLETRIVSWLRHPTPPTVELCVVRSAYDWVLRRDRFHAWLDAMAERGVAIVNPPPVLRWGSDKSYLLELEARGIAIVPTSVLRARQPVRAESLFARHDCDRLVLKPAVGVAAREVLRVDRTDAPAAQAHLDRLLATEDVLAQPYYRSIESDGEVSAIWIAGQLSHGVRKTPKAGDFRAMFAFGCAEQPLELPDDARELASRVATRLDAGVLFARVDMLRAPDGGLRVSEVELVSPTLYFDHDRTACERLADAICLSRRGA